MYKKSLIILCVLLLSLSAVAVGYAEENLSATVTVLDGDKIIFQKEYPKNPEFFCAKSESLSARAKDFGAHYSHQSFCDYIFGSLGSDITQLFDSIQNISSIDCIKFNKKDFTFEYNAQKSAWEIDLEDFFEQLYKNIENQSITLSVKWNETEPKFCENELKNLTQKIGEYQTDYATSISSRKKNIKIASNKISGIVVSNGEVFSFNKVVGKRTKENGFEEAKVILNGEYVVGVGGGVCQVATTLYNALLRAGFSPVSCTRHTLAPSYVPLSFDAMVSEQADLKMRNDTGSAVYIGMSANGEKLKAVVFGKKSTLSYKFESEIIETLIHQDAETDIGSIYKNGYKSRGYKLIYKNGNFVKKVLLREDEYKPYKLKSENKKQNNL